MEREMVDLASSNEVCSYGLQPTAQLAIDRGSEFQSNHLLYYSYVFILLSYFKMAMVVSIISIWQ